MIQCTLQKMALCHIPFPVHPKYSPEQVLSLKYSYLRPQGQESKEELLGNSVPEVAPETSAASPPHMLCFLTEEFSAKK